MPVAVVLDACPVCRATLDGAPVACPACSSDLRVYRELAGRASELIALAREQLARGDSSLAREVALRLPQLVNDPGPAYYALAAHVALRDGRADEARLLAARADPTERQVLEQLSGDRQTDVEGAREQYNYALTAARAGRFDTAARHLDAALRMTPDAAEMWQLRLKVDLKRTAWPQVYADLAELDRLEARPSEFVGLERLLPVLPRRTG